MSLTNRLPPPVKSIITSTLYDYFMESNVVENSSVIKSVPIYLKRQGFLPRKPEDFGDGGAFPEIHVSQSPLGMGSNSSNNTSKSKILPVTVDALGNVAFDAIVKQNENSKQIVYSQHSDLVPKILKNDVEEDEEELEKEIVQEETKAAIEKILNSAAKPNNVVKQLGGAKYIKYKPSQESGGAFNSGAKERIIRMAEMQVDPLDVPKFKHKKVPKPYGSSNPVPVLHSPPRAATAKDREDWTIPPCISGWKNGKGYTIPLDKRLANDGRGLVEVQVSDKFAKFSEALYVGEEKCREAVSMRLKVNKEMGMLEKERKEQELRVLAQKARSERAAAATSESGVEMEEEKEERIQRDKIRKERVWEREREKRKMESKKSKITRDRDRDVSEKVALGMACTGGKGGEVMYDQRLFNQEKGMDYGFANDDSYNLYDKGLFTAKATLSTLYRPKKDMDDEMYGNADEQLDKLKKTERFKPDKAFSGASEGVRKRDRPVEFEKEDEKEDPFGLERFVSDMKNGKKKVLDRIGSGGTMAASCSNRTKIDFERSS